MTTATVTVLFTDLVASTSLLSRVGPDAAEAVRRAHFELLREAVARFGGTEVKNLGDGLMVVFASVSEALGCGVAMHQGVERHNRRAVEPMGLRVAVAHGEADVEAGDYFGPCVVEASRLCAAAQGGQLLTSGLVAMMMGGRAGFEFDAATAVEAKGFPDPIEAHAVAWSSNTEPLIPMPVGLQQRDDTPPLVGRDDELAQLAACWKLAVSGERQMVFVSGEPGVGKTRLAAELAVIASQNGAIVLFGRCDEDVGIAYQPFAEALGHYVASCPIEVIETHVATFGGVVAGSVPELGRRLANVRSPERADPDAERLLFFDAVTALVAAAAEQAPVLLVLDDVHWASKPTLLLLRHLLRAVPATELLVVATYRDTDLDRAHPLAEVLAELRRAGGSVRIALAGLDEAGVRALVEAAAGVQLDDAGIALAGAVHAETDGNPFFAGEVLRHLAESGVVYQRDGRWVSDVALHDLGIPEGIREVVGRRMARLSADANRALAIAAVIGAEFELTVVEQVGEFSAEQVLDAIDEAIAARLVLEVTGAVGRCRFTHALVRQTLYAECSSARRAQLHRRVAETLETVHGADLDAHLAVLAYHYAEGARAGDTTLAVDYALRAGAEAVSRTAFEEAEVIVQRGLSVLEFDSVTDDDRHFELLMALADAQGRSWSAGFEGTGLQAAAVARRLHSPERLARTAVMATRRVVRVGLTDPDNEALCEEALEALGDRDDSLRAQVLAVLATLRGLGGHGWDDVLPLAREAVAVALRSGDSEAQGRAAWSLGWALRGMPALSERYECAEELIALGHTANDPLMESQGLMLRGFAHAAAGDRAGFEHDFDRVGQYADRTRILVQQAVDAQCRALLALLDGRFDDVEELAANVLAISAEQPAFLLGYFGQMGMLRYEQGRLEEFMPGALDVFAQNQDLVVLHAFLAHSQAELGHHQDAHQRFEPLIADDCAPMPPNWLYPGTLAHLASTCVLLDHVASAAALIQQVAPYSGQLLVMASTVNVCGAADRYLAMLETMTGAYDAADVHFQQALALEEQAGGIALAARTRYWHARMLTARNDPADRDQARTLLADCMDTATRLGMAALQLQAHHLAAGLDETVARPAHRNPHAAGSASE